MASTRNPSWEWQTFDHTIVKLDYVWATKKYHVWVQPPTDNQAYWIGQTGDPVDAEALIKGYLRSWSDAITAQIRSVIDALAGYAA